MKVSPPSKIVAFNPTPQSVAVTTRDLKEESNAPVEVQNSEAALALAQSHPKSMPVSIHKAMEGPRTGMPHLTPHTLRYRAGHERVGTKIAPDERLI